MQPADDMQLVRQYAANGCDDAFKALVERHVNLVHSVALRHVGQAHQAEEITQAVFIILARKAAQLPPGTILAGWLYQTSRLTAANAVRRETRRAIREQEAHMRMTLDATESAEAWPHIAPLLDHAMGTLSDQDRNAIVLRFLENKSLGEVGQVLGVKENAAKMRVTRALEKLRRCFERRGVTLSIAILAEVLASHSVQAAPMALTASTAAVAQGTAATASTLALANTTLQIMSATKTKTILITLVALLFLTTAVTSVIIFFYLHNREATGPLTFAELREQDIPGRYKWSEGPTENFLVLYEDHTFMNKDGTVFPMYRWDVTAQGLALTWQRTTTVFTNIEGIGIYTTSNGNRAPIRLEKLPPYTAAQLITPTPVASLNLGTLCETNGLTPVNTSGDGEILPGNIDGADCYRLVRKAGRNAAYLYLQIAPELKDPPFTNALVIVEFFDRSSDAGLPGRLIVQYDDESGPYANSEPLRMTGSQTWQEVTFYIPTPLFQNGQNAGGDLRLSVSRSELPIRSIKLVKNAILPETKMPSVKPL